LNKLKQVRFLKELRQIDVEKLSGVHRSSISIFENYSVEPSREQKKRLADALEVPVNTLWPKATLLNSGAR